jgi:hypothetical protein
LVPLPLLAIGIGLAAAALLVLAQQRRAHGALVEQLRVEWGATRDRARDMTAIAEYSTRRGDTTPEALRLDDRTWADLNMDEVFAVVDRTESAVGQQVLYARLRRRSTAGDREAFEALATAFATEPARRESAQLVLGRLHTPAAYDLWRLTEPGLLETEPWYVVFPLLTTAMVASAVLAPFVPPLILVLVCGALVNIALRGVVAPRLRLVTGPFRQLTTLLAVAGRLSGQHAAHPSVLTAPLASDLPRLSKLRRIAGWAGRDASAAGAGDVMGLVFEYLNVLLFLDANALYFGARELRARASELGRVLDAVGTVDAAISTASYRAGTPGWTRPVFTAPGTPLEISGVRHPLLDGAVPNSIALGPPYGVIVTGSNMSGKSTFLRTLGVTAVLAEAINTCIAERYQSPPLAVRSCIGRSDDPSTGRSYYLMEVDLVLDLVRAARSGTPHLLLFDELFRGTNAVERIAAGEAILAALVPGRPGPSATGTIVVAATHDQELVDLLADRYDAFHFTDRVDQTGLAFDYRLNRGPATSRNAIALLEMRGAPPDIVARALARSAFLDAARVRSLGR